MKTSKICLFLISVFVLLGLLCMLVPEGGITLFGTTINAPDLGMLQRQADAPDTDTDYDVTEEVTEQPAPAVASSDTVRNDSLRLSAEVTPVVPSPTIIQMPYVHDVTGSVVGQDAHYFDPLFEALDNARRKHVRIIHYGDSQIEEDRITAYLREQLQKRFGGGGPGLQPATNDVPKMTVQQSSSIRLTRYRAYGTSAHRADHQDYGPMAQFQHVDDETVDLSFTILKSKQYPHNTLFDKVTLITDEGLEVVSANCNSNKVKFSVPGPTDIYGVMFDSYDGVAVDNIPMRSCMGDIFNSISKASVKPFFDSQNVRLIILQYGGNMMPGMSSEEQVDQYCEVLQHQIRHLHHLVPEAQILFIGPSDMSTLQKGKWVTYPLLPYFTWVLANTVNEAGAAYWDMYTAMGGDGSMVKWVNSNPPLAGPDYVHFTHRGADSIANMLTETILSYYKQYKPNGNKY